VLDSSSKQHVIMDAKSAFFIVFVYYFKRKYRAFCYASSKISPILILYGQKKNSTVAGTNRTYSSGAF